MSVGITQQASADAIGSTLRTYQRYESDTTEPSLNDLSKLCVLFGVTSDYLLGLTDQRR